MAPFDVLNPSAENIAKYFYDEISSGLGRSTPVKLVQVRIWETDTTCATYRP
jgi:6-pyruvoyltetrahydropterin/6-carboxytetrahydropterin synthase